ncbi:hypothetical protein V6N12_025406 [Hibiscus sabdariffa]|uniref:NADH dehydrogenase [ubiquinone] 1 alpha subcomplex subunit 1 n=1 Tax=Hibiscus sabdariffa TaxID=183260 RepID=A0ABR2CIB0_9ROSI
MAWIWLEAALPLGIIAGMLCVMGNAQYFIHTAYHGRTKHIGNDMWDFSDATGPVLNPFCVLRPQRKRCTPVCDPHTEAHVIRCLNVRSLGNGGEGEEIKVLDILSLLKKNKEQIKFLFCNGLVKGCTFQQHLLMFRLHDWVYLRSVPYKFLVTFHSLVYFLVQF